MEKVGIFFGSDGGNSKNAAEQIAAELGNAELIDVASPPNQFANHRYHKWV